MIGAAFYLPRPSALEYEFRYVNSTGEVCARSRSFTFCAPQPLEELETLRAEQDEDEEDGEEGLLLVIPRAQLLQVGTRTESATRSSPKHCSRIVKILCVPVEATGGMLAKAGGDTAGSGRDQGRHGKGEAEE